MQVGGCVGEGNENEQMGGVAGGEGRKYGWGGRGVKGEKMGAGIVGFTLCLSLS